MAASAEARAADLAVEVASAAAREVADSTEDPITIITASGASTDHDITATATAEAASVASLVRWCFLYFC